MGFIKVLTSGPNEALIISGKKVRFRPYFSTNPTFKNPLLLSGFLRSGFSQKPT